MTTPLALTIFNRYMSDEFKFDILFGRKHVCVGICVEVLMEQCIKEGLTARFASNKEKGKLDNSGVSAYKYKGKVILVGNDQQEFPLMDGILFRALYHSQSPISLIKSYVAIT